mgnify:CR=1 FL=1
MTDKENRKGNSVGLAVMLILSISLILSVVLSSCSTWKWVEPMTPDAANNHKSSIKHK